MLIRLKCNVISLDAWANPEGWDINNWNYCGEIEFNQEDDKQEFNELEIFNALMDNEYLNPLATMDKIAIEDWFENSIIILNKDNAEPLYQLEIIDEWEVDNPYNEEG